MQSEKIGRYEIKAELGRGGMATVYRGYDPRFEREVAVKVLPPELLHADPQFRLRFEREAKIIAQLEHPSIVPVYDVGEESDQPYFVMRFMNGGSLSERVKAGLQSLAEATRVLGQIAPGLDEAHSKGIVHRDLKPSNILFDRKGSPYISDFGIAKLVQDQAGNVTGSAIIGTPAYMAPEQASGEAVDGRADIYALGIILFEMLTGKQPYQADTPMGVAIKHITEPVPQILDANPNLPAGMDAIIQKAMAKDRNERFATALDMVNALQAVAQGDVTQVHTGAAPTLKGSVVRKGPVPVQRRGFSALFIVIPVVAVAVVAGGLLFYNGSRRPVKTEAPVSTSTSQPPVTETSAPTDHVTDLPVVIVEATSTEAPRTPTESPTTLALPVIGGADKIAFVANNEIWSMNLDGTDPEALTNDGAAKSDLQWLPDGETLIFISGRVVKSYNMRTGVLDTLTSFPSASSLDAFHVSHDGKQAMISVNNEIFIVPFDFNTMKAVSKKSDLLALEPCILPKGRTRSALIVREGRWSADDQLVAWLYQGPDPGNAALQSDQVSVLSIRDCNPDTIDLLDNFPGQRFIPVGFQTRIIPDFDWDGFNLFVFNTSRRNNGWGELYVYNWETHKPYQINPIEGKCCYRDARWSPDGAYLFFAFQDANLGAAAPTFFYYVPYGEIGTGANFSPITLPEGFLKNPKEAPQPALHPAQ
ncbi:MAG TPA: protein kinase [Anaerolineales bacterium]|nr:protein kinase [Anaerolineales bacterium]